MFGFRAGFLVVILATATFSTCLHRWGFAPQQEEPISKNASCDVRLISIHFSPQQMWTGCQILDASPKWTKRKKIKEIGKKRDLKNCVLKLSHWQQKKPGREKWTALGMKWYLEECEGAEEDAPWGCVVWNASHWIVFILVDKLGEWLETTAHGYFGHFSCALHRSVLDLIDSVIVFI